MHRGQKTSECMKKSCKYIDLRKGDMSRITGGLCGMGSVERLYDKVLEQKIEQQFAESEEQNGFIAGRSYIDGNSTFKNFIEKRTEKRRAIHLILVHEKHIRTIQVR